VLSHATPPELSSASECTAAAASRKPAMPLFMHIVNIRVAVLVDIWARSTNGKSTAATKAYAAFTT
jgi:hypothetical protein